MQHNAPKQKRLLRLNAEQASASCLWLKVGPGLPPVAPSPPTVTGIAVEPIAPSAASAATVAPAAAAYRDGRRRVTRH